ncbi:glutamine amidotransferase-related protein [Acinetobacter rathckeae]|uniref:glutamine amidotransferase-related protein n=1 Tax=Acinetobacter rathckeae TaxID=2605272 RepID=UPI0018A265C2|nr:CTP synthase [Acinetobacter rathckeae]MBF7688580.1 CTP synthase [Acinetobacter rathckeae]MBF7695827.1 CTP synthase [Acinetobacter rathckeae]
MLPLFIVDDAKIPAHYGITASMLANQKSLPLWSLRPTFHNDFPDSHQHVIAAGYCVSSGLFLSNTLQHEVTDVSQLPTHDAVIVLAEADAPRIAHLKGERLSSKNLPQPEILTPASTDNRTIRIGLMGHVRDQRDSYPANLLSLQAAAKQLHLKLDIRLLSPEALCHDLHELDELHGVVLPGGSSMAAVLGQIAVAKATLHRGIPTLGLCLGMQSMCTAVVQHAIGFEEAILAEVASHATLHSFIRFDDFRHRCGLFAFPAPAPFNYMHYNHRYYFNPKLRPQLLAGGIDITVQNDDIVEAIRFPSHTFWQGVQGHPELMSRPNAPHPLFIDFLQAVAQKTI